MSELKVITLGGDVLAVDVAEIQNCTANWRLGSLNNFLVRILLSRKICRIEVFSGQQLARWFFRHWMKYGFDAESEVSVCIHKQQKSKLHPSMTWNSPGFFRGDYPSGRDGGFPTMPSDGAKTLVKVFIPDSVTSIRDNAFFWVQFFGKTSASRIQSTSIGSNTFFECSSLEKY